jgi:Sulfotransferase family
LESHMPLESTKERAYAQVRRLRGAVRRRLAGRREDSAGTPSESALARSSMESEVSSTPVFFVTGVGKSGTRWLTKILDSHPEVLCKGEGRFFSAGWRRADLDPESERALASSLYYALMHSEHLRLWVERSVWSRDDDPDEHLRALMRLATEYFLMEELSKSGKRLVGDKSPLQDEEFMREVSEVYPGAKVIHIIRDGRDRTISSMHRGLRRASQGYLHRLTPEELARWEAHRDDPRKLMETGEGMFTEERLRQAARHWRLLVGRAVEDGPALLGSDYTEVRYEDLLEHPNEEVERLLGFLGAGTDPGIVEHCVSSASFEKLSRGRERGQEDPSSFYRKGVSGDWKNHFTDEDKRIFKEEAGELLMQLGYERDLDW